MRFTIDRFEGDCAVLEAEDGKTFDVNILFIPKGAKEGDVLRIEIDTEDTAARKSRIDALAKKLWKD